MGKVVLDRVLKDDDVVVLHPFELHPRPMKMDESMKKRFDAAWENHIKPMAKSLSIEINKPQNQLSHDALAAGELARDKGLMKEYHDAAFKAVFVEGKSLEDREVLLELCKEVGLDPQEVQSALDSHIYDSRISDSMKKAGELGITGVPAYIINGKLHVGLLTEDELKKML